MVFQQDLFHAHVNAWCLGQYRVNDVIFKDRPFYAMNTLNNTKKEIFQKS